MANAYPKPWITGGPILRLHEGWAMMSLQGSRGHYWREDTWTMPPSIGDGGRVRYYQSLCGVAALTDDRRPAHQIGSWPRCRRCERKAAKNPTPSDAGSSS